MRGVRPGTRLLLGLLMAMSGPLAAATIDLSQLCGAGDCVVATNTTINSASGPLTVGGNFTVNPGVVLQFLVPIQIKVAGNMVVSGTIGAPGDGGAGGIGGGSGQPGGAGASAPSVVNGTFDVTGTITLDSNAAAVAEGGAGGSGGLPGFGNSVGGAGGAGGAAGSLRFNTCSSFNSASGAQIVVNGGPGGVGQAGATGGAGGSGGTVIINAKQTILSNGLVSALGGAGGSGGSGTGGNGSDGFITLRSSGGITVGSGTLVSGLNTPTIVPASLGISDLAYCSASPITAVPTFSEWTVTLLATLLAMLSIHRLRRRIGPRSNFRSNH